MSIELMNRVLECDAFDESSHKFVLLLLANCANAEGFCYPSRGYIGRITKLHSDTVARAMIKLKEQGHLTENKREGMNSTFIVHPVIDPKKWTEAMDRTPRMVRGGKRSASPDVEQALNDAAHALSATARGGSRQGEVPEKATVASRSDARSQSSSAPRTMQGVTCEQPCGQTIHSPPHHAVTPPAPCGDTPRTMRDETSEKHQLNIRAPDDKNNPQTGTGSELKAITEGATRDRRRHVTEPTAAETEARKAEQLAKIRAKGIAV